MVATANARRTGRVTKRVIDSLKAGTIVWDSDVTGFVIYDLVSLI